MSGLHRHRIATQTPDVNSEIRQGRAVYIKDSRRTEDDTKGSEKKGSKKKKSLSFFLTHLLVKPLSRRYKI